MQICCAENNKWVYYAWSDLFVIFIAFAFGMKLHKNSSFPLKIFALNVTKFAGNCGFGHIY